MEIKLPKLGFTMEEGKLVEWLAADGAKVNAGDLIFALEAEKSVQEVEAPQAGILRILKQPGEYPVGTVLCVIEA